MEENQHEYWDWDCVAIEMSKILNREVDIYSFEAEDNNRDITFHITDPGSGNDYLLQIRQEWNTDNFSHPKTYLSYERMSGTREGDSLRSYVILAMYSEEEVAEEIVDNISNWIPVIPNRVKRFKDFYE